MREGQVAHYGQGDYLHFVALPLLQGCWRALGAVCSAGIALGCKSCQQPSHFRWVQALGAKGVCLKDADLPVWKVFKYRNINIFLLEFITQSAFIFLNLLQHDLALWD